MSSPLPEFAIHRFVLSVMLGAVLGFLPSVAQSVDGSVRAPSVSLSKGDRVVAAPGQETLPTARKAPVPSAPITGAIEAAGKRADVEIAALDWLGSDVDGAKAGVSRIGRGRAPPRVG